MTTKNILWSILTAATAFGALLTGHLFVTSPDSIRQPRLEHAHFRMQLIVNGAYVNFGDDKFQNTYKATCIDELPAQPIHFHDHRDQMVHLHWKHLTGGMVLKNYGWNLIGGANNTLGHRFDQLPFAKPVPTYGNVLPTLPPDAKLWVYAGDESSYQQRDTVDFFRQDVETFFGKKSTVNAATTTDTWRNLFFTRATAHAGHDHTEKTAQPDALKKSQEELQRINNLLGNVVIFAQKDQPSEAQIRERFSQQVPLEDSSCGG